MSKATQSLAQPPLLGKEFGWQLANIDCEIQHDLSPSLGVLIKPGVKVLN